MSSSVTTRGRLSDPRHIELDEAVVNLTGLVEVVLRPASNPSPGLPSPADRVAKARALQLSAPAQGTDSATLVREDRQR
jgi:hypothetical protein